MNRKGERGAVEIQIALFLPILVMVLVGGVAIWRVLQAQQTANRAALVVAEVLSGQPATQLPGQPPMAEQAIAAAKRQIVANYPSVAVEDISIKTIPAYTGPRSWAPVAGDPFEVYVSFPWVIWPGAQVGPDGPFGFLAEEGVITGRSQGWFCWEKEIPR